MKRVLVTRTDGMGDVLLTGPAVRALAATGARVTMLVGPAGREAACALPGVADVVVTRLPWIDANPRQITPEWCRDLVRELGDRAFDTAVLFASFHQSSLPLALLCRLAGIAQIAAISEDYPGSLLDVRHHVDEDLHEVERNLSLIAAIGVPTPVGDKRRLGVLPDVRPPIQPRLVVAHCGASAPARTLSVEQWRAGVAALVESGFRVVLSGNESEQARADCIVRGLRGACSLAGGTNFATMTALLARAEVVVAGNTGPAHLAAAVGRPVVSVFAPTVPLVRWHPWGVPYIAFGDHDIECRGCRARVCPFPRQPCLANVRPEQIVMAVQGLASKSGAAA